MTDIAINILIGLAIGLGAGIGIGIAIGKKQKPWSELTEEEKRTRKIMIGALSALLALGVIVFFAHAVFLR